VEPPEPLESAEIEASRRDVTALILAGGRSLRLGGLDKCSLVVGGVSLLERRIVALRPVVKEIVVVAGAPSVEAPRLAPYGGPDRVVADEPGITGPLAGLLAGLRATRTPWAFATACDMPFFEAGLYARLFAERAGQDAVVPAVDGWYEPVLAATRDGGVKMASFFPAVRARFVSAVTLRAHDPELRSFLNVNTAEELERVRLMLEDAESRPEPPRAPS
jgi:molybdopterin-guanine dinucleotide biosynthesis protein A